MYVPNTWMARNKLFYIQSAPPCAVPFTCSLLELSRTGYSLRAVQCLRRRNTYQPEDRAAIGTPRDLYAWWNAEQHPCVVLENPAALRPIDNGTLVTRAGENIHYLFKLRTVDNTISSAMGRSKQARSHLGGSMCYESHNGPEF